MRGKIIIGLFVVFFMFAASANGNFGGGMGGIGGSGGGGGGKGKGMGGPSPVPEPMSCLLFLASGATYVGIRYLRARRNSNKLNNHSHETGKGI